MVEKCVKEYETKKTGFALMTKPGWKVWIEKVDDPGTDEEEVSFYSGFITAVLRFICCIFVKIHKKKNSSNFSTKKITNTSFFFGETKKQKTW